MSTVWEVDGVRSDGPDIIKSRVVSVMGGCSEDGMEIVLGLGGRKSGNCVGWFAITRQDAHKLSEELGEMLHQLDALADIVNSQN